MRKLAMAGAMTLVALSAACKKTGDGQYQVQTPNVNVSSDTHTVQTPTVETGTRKDTLVTTTPTVTVKTPAERHADSVAAAKKKP